MAILHSVEYELAAIAHRLWCEGMIAQGWRPGPFDPDRRTHDAIVPFEHLSAVDKHSTTIGVAALELIDQLRDSVDYSRGDAREFSAAELSVGLRVGFVGDNGMLGSIQEWQEDPSWPGCVRTITVRWDSGEVVEYAAAECELRRVEALR